MGRTKHTEALVVGSLLLFTGVFSSRSLPVDTTYFPALPNFASSSPSVRTPGKQGTILTGYGGRTPYASTVALNKTVVTITAEQDRHVDHEVVARTLDAPLFVQHRGYENADCLQVYSAGHDKNVTIRVEAGDIHVRDEEASNSVGSSSEPTTTFLQSQWTPVQSLYGVYSLPSGHVFVWIVDSEPIYGPLSIHRVTEMHLTKVVKPSSCLTPEERIEEQRQLKLLRRSLKDHEWYFCEPNDRLQDMTRSLQATHLYRQEQDMTWVPDEGFYWNADLVAPLTHASTNDSVLLQHITPVTSAFCSVEHQSLYDQVLISRRSKFRAGTRFTKRGADATGAVANGVETEQILAVKNATVFASFVQTRGSLPLFWSSPTDIKTYRPRVRIGTDPVAQARTLLAHLRDHLDRYSIETENRKDQNTTSVLVVNLIDKKSDQGRLGKAFDAVLNAVLDVYNGTMTGVEHVWFDFHAEVKKGQWHKLVGLLEQAEPTLQRQGYFLLDSTTGTVEKKQDGVIRTNCMDCLDRTNVVQGMFARYMLFCQLVDMGYIGPLEKVSFRNNLISLPSEYMEQTHRLLWADNADSISRLYAGTAALKGDFTRTGKRTKMGALDDGMNSLQRYYKNNFLDADRQEGIDLMTGNRPFSGIEKTETMGDVQKSDDLKSLSSDVAQIPVHEAVRRIFLGIDKRREELESERSYVPINIKGGATDGKRKWGLGWLPGDLQAQVNSLNSKELETMDQRAASTAPWWVGSDSTDSDSDETLSLETPSPFNPNISSPVAMCAAVIAGIHSPVAVACAVVGLMASSAFQGVSKSENTDED